MIFIEAEGNDTVLARSNPDGSVTRFKIMHNELDSLTELFENAGYGMCRKLFEKMHSIFETACEFEYKGE